MKILSEYDKKYVEKYAYDLLENKKDWKHHENLKELVAAIYIIEKIIGSLWYRRAAQELQEKKSLEKYDEFQTPMSYYLGSGKPEEYSRIIQFGGFLKILICCSNVEDKINEYVKKEKRSEITKNLFDSLFFEFKVASYFGINGFEVEFIKESKQPSPDLKIISQNGYEIIECKKKRSNNISLESIRDSINTASEQLESFGENGIVALELPSNSLEDKLDMDQIIVNIQSLISDLKKIDAVWLLQEKIIHEEGKTKNITKKRLVIHETPFNTPPIDIIEIVKQGKSIKQSSLLED